MKELFISLLNMSIVASWLILAVIIFRHIFKRAPKWIVTLMWCLVGFRLLCPFSIQSPISLIPSTNTFVMDSNNVTVDTGLNNMDTALNAYLSQSYNKSDGYVISFSEHILTSHTASILLYIWLGGIALLLIRSLISYLRLKNKLSDAVRYESNVYQTERINSPFVLGIIRPRIFIPYYLEAEQLDCVIIHEKSHIKRKDHIIKPIGYTLLAIYWFNPLVWLAFVMFCRDIELACDEKVIREIGLDKRKLYSETLLKCSIQQSMLLSCPVAFAEVNVKERILNIMKIKKTNKVLVLAALLVALAVTIVFTTNPVNASGKDESDSKETRRVVYLTDNSSGTIYQNLDTNNIATNISENNNDETNTIIEDTNISVSDNTTENISDTVQSVDDSIVNNSDYTQVESDINNHQLANGDTSANPTDNEPSTNISNDISTNDTVNTNTSSNNSSIKLIFPVLGNAITTSEYNDNHQAVDYAAPSGTPLVASISGTVTAVGFDNANGNYLVITNADGCSVYYNNCETILVSVNASVNAGDSVATLGSTGKSTGPHLDFAVSDSTGTFYNPANYY